MRVGLIIYGSLDTISGGYLYDRKLVEYLRSCGDQVEVISLPWRNYLTHITDNFSPAWRRQLQSLRLDILLQDELNHPSLFLANRYLRPQLVFPIISIVHHLRSSEDHPASLLWLYRRVEDAYLGSVNGFIFNSRTTRKVVESRIRKSRPHVTAQPAAEHFADLPSDTEIRARALQPGPLRVLFLANLIPRKGLHSLLRAVASLPPGMCYLTVAGNPEIDPSYARQIQEQAAQLAATGQVGFVTKVARREIPGLLRSHQVLAVPSSYEGFGIVYLEGFEFGLPALAAARGGAGEIVSPGETGWLVDPGQPEEIARRLAQLSADRELLARMSLAARVRFAQHPSWEETNQRVREFLVSQVEEGHHDPH